MARQIATGVTMAKGMEQRVVIAESCSARIRTDIESAVHGCNTHGWNLVSAVAWNTISGAVWVDDQLTIMAHIQAFAIPAKPFLLDKRGLSSRNIELIHLATPPVPPKNSVLRSGEISKKPGP